jgi:membrane-bound serine protease (ClpP class)
MLLVAAFFAGESPDVRADGADPATTIVIASINNDAITPITSRFILRSIEEAEKRRAQCLIIVLDTPGGLIESTRDIVKAILHSRVPVVVYVAPTGARAASAGVFITLAGHVAAMAPGTNIGAAHPVSVGGMPGQPSQPDNGERPASEPANSNSNTKDKPRTGSPMEDKVVNDTVAWVRSLAELRGRNAEWAESTVKESISVTAAVALEQNAIDLIAEDLNDLLAKIDGRDIKLMQGSSTLAVSGATTVELEMWWGERVLSVVANPTLAFLLLIFGFYGILFEFYSPGWGVSGTLGVICLVLGFFAMAILPVSYVGLALIIIALAMFVAEVFVVSYGFLTIGGAVCLVLGGLMLVDAPPGFASVPIWLLIPVALATAAVSFFLVGSIVKAQRVPAQTGVETISQSKAKAIEDFREDAGVYRGRVDTHGEIWNAVSDVKVNKGADLVVEGRDGLTLVVRPAVYEQAVDDKEN